MSTGLLRNPLILALDVDSDKEALQIVDDLGDIVGGVKLGPRLCVRYGKNFIQQVAKKVPVFVDNKYFDIPSTTVAAVEASFEAGASLVTVHALNGSETLQELAKLEKKLNKERPFKILCVTILTSFQKDQLSKSLKDESIDWHVKNLSQEVQKSGLSGLVCSPHELGILQTQGLYIVTPGIRMDTGDRGDQKRVMGPQDAFRAGASALVVGRPILQATNPKQAAEEFVKACK